jgi:hypothetical protein
MEFYDGTNEKAKLTGHTAAVYALTLLPNNDIVSEKLEFGIVYHILP